MRIQNGRWDELDVAGFDDDLPPGAVYVAVMRRAEQDTIAQRRLAAVDPMPHMVRIASSGRAGDHIPGTRSPDLWRPVPGEFRAGRCG